MLAARPYPDAEALVARAEEVARALPWDDVAVALAAHPRIGDRVEGSSAEAQASRREQSSMSDADAAVRAALLEGNRAYEQRFDHVFLIRAAGRAPAEMLAELRRRLGNDEAAERAEVTEQLAQITGCGCRDWSRMSVVDARAGRGDRAAGRRHRRPPARRARTCSPRASPTPTGAAG